MRFAAFSRAGAPDWGLVEGDGVHPASATPGAPARLEALIAEGPSARAMAERLALAAPVPLAQVRLEAPLRTPRKFLAIASNYRSHIEEVQRKNPAYTPPTAQRWFNKQVSCIGGPCDPILMPAHATELDYEVELAVIIGKRCRHVAAAEARACIWGYAVCNDVSVRDWQRQSTTITLGKSYDSHGPLGPWIVAAEAIADPHALRLSCSVNGETRQRGDTSEMLHDCFAQIAYLSSVTTLEPGDILATGTPGGTGAGLDPPRLLRIGDRVRCEVEAVGAIENLVVAEGG